MYKIKSIAIFYSKNSNLEIANLVKNTLNNLKIHTIYSADIDDVILNRYSKIDYLILDFTSSYLDKRSIELLVKSKKYSNINHIIVIDKSNNFFCKDFDLSINSNIENNLVEFVSKQKENVLASSFEPSHVSLIGDFLTKLGFSSKHSGYLMLIKGISLYLYNNNNIKFLNKDLYPYLANFFVTTEYNANMCLRTAIKSAFNNNKINGNFNRCPGIKEFLVFVTTHFYGVISNLNSN